MARVPSALRRYAPHLLVAASGVLIFFVASDLFPYHSANHDEGVYLQQAAMLLEGQLTIQPPVEDAFRPWFFVEDGDTLYPKYAPVPAAIFAIPLAIGLPRLALALVGATIVGLTFSITKDLFDNRTGLLAGALLLASPLFVLDTATFLPYAPTTALNLAFAYAYLRAERPSNSHDGGRSRTRWAAFAGLAIGLAFFSRPYTAVLFAVPFIAHSLWSLARVDTTGWSNRSVTPLLQRRFATALCGLFGVALTLGYNWTLTGHPLLFPYQVFAPLDGLGFGHREILGHDIQYTPLLALEVAERILRTYLLTWAPLGLLGSLLTVVGLAAATDQWGWRRSMFAGLFVSVVVGNLYFWGSYNILGVLDAPGDGLISILGPYYHFDLLVPTAIFAAHGSICLARTVRRGVESTLPTSAVRPVLTVVLAVSLAVSGAATVAAFDDPVSTNAAVTSEYERAYAPFTDADGPPKQAVVFLPEPYGPWLNHPFQALRNHPGYEDDTIYALHENEFEVVDAYPDRHYYRYAYRGTWYPFDGSSVTPTLQPVSAVSGETVTAAMTIELPAGTSSTSLRLASNSEQAYYAAPANGSSQRLAINVNESRAWASGPGIDPTGAGTVSVEERDTLVVLVNVNTEGGGFTYRIVFPVASTPDGERRALTPELEVCTVPQLCGGEAAHIPGPGGSGFSMNVTLRAS